VVYQTKVITLLPSVRMNKYTFNMKQNWLIKSCTCILYLTCTIHPVWEFQLPLKDMRVALLEQNLLTFFIT